MKPLDYAILSIITAVILLGIRYYMIYKEKKQNSKF